MPAGEALYYPYMHFWNVGWLKSTALYWDSVSRIVPDGFEPKDSDEVKRLIDAGYVDPEPDRRHPQGGALINASNAIEQLLDTHGDELRARYGLENRASWTATDPNISSLRWMHQVPGLDHRLSYIHEGKWTYPIGSSLTERELAEQVPGMSWYGVHPRLQEAYMWALASETASSRGLRLLADNPTHHTAIIGNLEEALHDFLLGSARSRGMHPHLDTVMMTVVLRNVRPHDYNDLPVSEIVALRHDTDEVRGELQLKLQDLVFDRDGYLQEIQDADELERRLGNLYNRRLRPSLDKMEKALKARNRVEWKGALAVSFVAPPSLLGALGHPAAWPLLVACAGGALFVGLWQARTPMANLRKEHPVAFYLQQIKDMKEDHVIEAVATTAGG
jgi:hypothetical protein